MFSRHTFLIVGLMVAGGAPYLSSKADLKGRMSSLSSAKQPAEQGDTVFQFASADSKSIVSPPSTNPFGGATASSPESTTSSSASTTTSVSNTTAPAQPTVLPASSARTVNSRTLSSTPKLDPVDGSKPIRFEEVFRLDVNSAWLMARWPRVSTGLAELDLHGYRVPLLTGIREDDLAGALTYYYDKEQVIQKMTFRGMTGDPRRLVLFCTGQYGLERETVTDPAVQVYRSKGTGRKPSVLTVRPANVIRADAPRERFEVDFVLHR